MGTSQSKKDPGKGVPLVPPWAAGDPPAETPGDVHLDELDSDEPKAPEGRYRRFRVRLTKFVGSGSKSDARAALGSWAASASGGSAASARRVERAIETGGRALAAFQRAQSDAPPQAGVVDLRSLIGMSAADAIDIIVDEFCPSGILDEDIARLALGEALAVACGDSDLFDPTTIPAVAVDNAVLVFITELTFAHIAADVGDSLKHAGTPAEAAAREKALRSLVREVVDFAGSGVLKSLGPSPTAGAMVDVMRRLVRTVYETMESWQ